MRRGWTVVVVAGVVFAACGGGGDVEWWGGGPSGSASAAGSDGALAEDPAARMVQEMMFTPALPPVGPNQPSPLSVATTVEADRTVTRLVDATEGGQLEVEDAAGNRFVLTVAPDTLLFDTEVSMTPVASAPTLAVDGATLTGVRLEPDGLRFYDWATLELFPAEGSGRRPARGYGIHGGSDELYGYPLDADPDRLLMHLLHFSTPIIVYGPEGGQLPPEPSVVVNSEPIDWESQISQAIRDVMQVERDAQLNGGAPSENLHEIIEQLMLLYYDKVVDPVLRRMVVDCAYFEANAHVGLTWERDATLFGLSERAMSRSRVLDSTAKALENCWAEATSGCIDPRNPGTGARLSGLSRGGQLFGVSSDNLDLFAALDPNVPLSPKCGDVFGHVLWHSRSVKRTEGIDGRLVQTETVDETVSVQANFRESEGGGYEDLGSKVVFTRTTTLVTKGDGCTVAETKDVARGSAAATGTDGGTFGINGGSAGLSPPTVQGQGETRATMLTFAGTENCGERRVQQSQYQTQMSGANCSEDGTGSGLQGSAEGGGTIDFGCKNNRTMSGNTGDGGYTQTIDVEAAGSLRQRTP